MRLNGREITIHTGESFGLNFELRNRDGSPYIISSSLNNPYYLLSISNTKFKQNERYVVNHWAITPQWSPRFIVTRAVDVTDPNYNGAYLNYESGWTNVTPPSYPGVGNYTIKSYSRGGVTYYYYADYVYYYEDSNGNRTYKYWRGTDSNTLATTGSWVEYSLSQTYTFSQQETSEWKASTYYYSLTLVAGQLMWNYLSSLASSLHLNNIPSYINTDELLYNYIKNNSDYQFPDDFDYKRSLGTYSDVIPLITPTAITVLTSINGDI